MEKSRNPQFIDAIVPSVKNTGVELTADSGLILQASETRLMRKTTLFVNGAVMAIPDAAGFGNLPLCTLPATGAIIMGVRLNLTLVKDGVGWINTTDLSTSVGILPASNIALSTVAGEHNLGGPTTISADNLTVSLVRYGGEGPSQIASGVTGSKIYLNASAATVGTNDASLTVTGWVTVYWFSVD